MRGRGTVLWVVYRMSLNKEPEGRNAVCEQSEWDEMQRRQPGVHTLIREGITDEAVAERLARGTSGDALKSVSVKKRS
jgi:hypothetical protein